MCGLVGIFHPHGTQPMAADVNAMLAVIRHRGPDGTGIHVSDDRRFVGGFSRLAIIDLATSNQPLVQQGGQRVLLGNGEIYNFLELRAELETLGHVFSTHGDMEPALNAEAQWGPDFLERLNGMFALAVYRRDSHSLLLARDRLGIKPLYWARTDSGALLFASEIKALFASGLIRPAIDESVLDSWLLHGYVPGERCLYAGVHKLPPGHRLDIDATGTVTVTRWWQPHAAAITYESDDHARDSLLALLEDSVRLQLQSDVPLGVLLSGGLDSGLITALAAKNSSRPLHTYTVRFTGASRDESPLAALVAKRYGTVHTCFDLGLEQVTEHLTALAWHCEEPLSDASLLPNHLINHVLGRDIRVVLNGTGGDELFAGYGRYFSLPQETAWRRLPRSLRRSALPLIGLLAPSRRWQLQRAESWDDDPGVYLAGHSTQFPTPWVRRLGRQPAAAAQSAAFDLWQGDRQGGLLAADIQTYLPEDLLLLLDRTTMAASVEGRVPFLDHRLVEAALALPAALRTPGNRQKGLQRRMAATMLPAEVLNAPKQGFASPVPNWMGGSLLPVARRLLTSRRSRQRGWFRAEGIDALLADPVTNAFRLYALTMLELSVRIHVDAQARSVPSLTDILDDE